MSSSALRTTVSSHRPTGVSAGKVEGKGRSGEPAWLTSSDRGEGLHAPAANAVVLEPHWQASIESATD